MSGVFPYVAFSVIYYLYLILEVSVDSCFFPLSLDKGFVALSVVPPAAYVSSYVRLVIVDIVGYIVNIFVMSTADI